MDDENKKEMQRLENLLHYYAQKVGLNNSNVDGDSINESYARLLLCSMVQDYQKFRLSIDDLSSLCERMWQKCEKYSSILLEGADISWYIRWRPEAAAEALRALINEFGKEWIMPAADNYKDL